MFLGEYQHTVDDKGRIVMPSKFRDQLKAGVVVTKGQERCLYVFPMDRWGEEMERLRHLSRNNKAVRNYTRTFFGGATDQKADKQGRLALPQTLRSYAGIDKDVTVVGVSDHIEIWNTDSWRSLSDETDRFYAEIEEELSGEEN